MMANNRPAFDFESENNTPIESVGESTLEPNIEQPTVEQPPLEPTIVDPTEHWPKYSLDDFELVRELGKGAFGQVCLYSVKSPDLYEEPYKSKLLKLKKQLADKHICDANGLVGIKVPFAEHANDPKIKSATIKEVSVAEQLWNYAQKNGQLEKPSFNLCQGIVLDGAPTLMTKPEGLKDFAVGDLEKFWAPRVRNNISDLDIFMVQMMCSQYASIEEMHKALVLHLDVGNRNFLARAPREGELDENGLALLYAALAADFGQSEIVDPETQSVITSRAEVPIRWMDREYLLLKIASPKSDLYSLRVCLIESLASLVNLNDSTSALGAQQDHIDLVMKGSQDSVRIGGVYIRLQYIILNNRFDALKSLSEDYKSAIVSIMECYKKYLLVVPGALTSSIPVYQADDKRLFISSNENFFRDALIRRINKNFNNDEDLDNFVLSIKRLVRITVGETFKEGDLYRACMELSNEPDINKQRELAKNLQQYVMYYAKDWKQKQEHDFKDVYAWQANILKDLHEKEYKNEIFFKSTLLERLNTDLDDSDNFELLHNNIHFLINRLPSKPMRDEFKRNEMYQLCLQFVQEQDVGRLKAIAIYMQQQAKITSWPTIDPGDIKLVNARPRYFEGSANKELEKAEKIVQAAVQTIAGPVAPDQAMQPTEDSNEVKELGQSIALTEDSNEVKELDQLIALTENNQGRESITELLVLLDHPKAPNKSTDFRSTETKVENERKAGPINKLLGYIRKKKPKNDRNQTNDVEVSSQHKKELISQISDKSTMFVDNESNGSTHKNSKWEAKGEKSETKKGFFKFMRKKA